LPPVANAGEIRAEGAGDATKATVRHDSEIHRDPAPCARCHDRIDPLGFALENFDALPARLADARKDRPNQGRVGRQTIP